MATECRKHTYTHQGSQAPGDMQSAAAHLYTSAARQMGTHVPGPLTSTCGQAHTFKRRTQAPVFFQALASKGGTALGEHSWKVALGGELLAQLTSSGRCEKTMEKAAHIATNVVHTDVT